LAKIPTDLYIYIPKRSSRGAFQTNIWANLTRKDTGEGLAAKKLLSFLDMDKVSEQYTQDETGYAGPFDINPKIEGFHTTKVIFEGDATWEPCTSEVVELKVDPNLLRTEIVMAITPVSGCSPLKVVVTGRVWEIRPDGSKTIPAYPLPLDLMVFDSTSTKRLQPVTWVMSNPDGSFKMEYTFTKLGTYRIFVNFLGDDKYASAWSNNGRTTTITVTGGELPLSFEKSVTLTRTESIQFKWILSQTEPATPEGYERFPDLDLDFGVLGKYWCFIKT